MKVQEIFADTPRGGAIIGIAIVMAVYAKWSGDARPFAVYVFGVSLAFLIYAINYLLGKLNS